MVKIYYLEELKKYGNTIGIPVPKKEMAIIGQEDKWKKGTKVRVLIEILPDDFKEDTPTIDVFDNTRKRKIPISKPSKPKPKPKKSVYQDPFSSAGVEVFEHEIPDKPTKKNVRDLNLKGQSPETK